MNWQRFHNPVNDEPDADRLQEIEAEKADAYFDQRIDRELPPMRQICVGNVFGRWTILNSACADEHRRKRFLCRCVCGTQRILQAYALRSGKTKSCGCLVRDQMREKKTTHGESTGRKQRREK